MAFGGTYDEIFLSPAGAGSKDGSSVDNAVQAIDSDDWSSSYLALDRARVRFNFLPGTYNVASTAIYTGTTPDSNNPNMWRGCSADGTPLTDHGLPKFDPTGMSLDVSNYPKFVASHSGSLTRSDAHTFIHCLHIHNTRNTANFGGSVFGNARNSDNNSFQGAIRRVFYGVKMECDHPINTNLEMFYTPLGNMTMCEGRMHQGSGTGKYRSVFRASGSFYSSFDTCVAVGNGSSAEAAPDSIGGSRTAFLTGEPHANNVVNCIGYNHGGHFLHMGTSSSTTRQNLLFCNNTGISCGGHFMDSSGEVSTITVAESFNANLCYKIGGKVFRDANNNPNTDHGNFFEVAYGDVGGTFENIAQAVTREISGVTAGDFFDYDNEDFRIRRDSPLYKGTLANRNFGALQNEDFEFVSVS